MCCGDGLRSELGRQAEHHAPPHARVPGARENNIEGKVVAQFVVDEKGGISDIRIIRVIGAGCDEELVRVIKLMPNWKPGLNNGQPVKANMIIPCTFKLVSDTEDQKNQEVKFVGGESA